MDDGPESRVIEDAVHIDSGSELVFEKRFQNFLKRVHEIIHTREPRRRPQLVTLAEYHFLQKVPRGLLIETTTDA